MQQQRGKVELHPVAIAGAAFGILVLVGTFGEAELFGGLLFMAAKAVLSGECQQPEGILHVLNIGHGQSGLGGEGFHLSDPLEGAGGGAQAAFVILHKEAQHAAHAVADEDVVPVHVQQRRDAHAAEEQLLPGKFFDIEQLANHFIREAEKFQQGSVIRASSELCILAHGILDQGAILEQAERDEGVQLRPHGGVIHKREPAEGYPAAGLAPDHAAHHVLRVAQFLGETLIFPAHERGVLSAALVFTPGLQFNDLGHLGAEEVPVQRQVAEEVALAVLHRHDERRAVQAVEHGGKGAAVPHQIANAVGTDRPGAEDQLAPVRLEHRQHELEKGVRLRWFFEPEAAVKIILHVATIGLADADDHACDLGKFRKEAVHQVANEQLWHYFSRVERGGGGEEIHRQVHRQSMPGKDGKAAAELLPINGDLGAYRRLVPFVISQVGDVIQRHGVEAEGADLRGKSVEIGPDARPVRLALGPVQRQVFKRDLRPVDRASLIATEERADGVDEIKGVWHGRR